MKADTNSVSAFCSAYNRNKSVLKIYSHFKNYIFHDKYVLLLLFPYYFS